MSATWEDILNKAEQNRKERYTREINEVMSAYQQFLDNLMKRVSEQEEVFAPSDYFTYELKGYLLQETEAELKKRGFEYNNAQRTVTAYPSCVKA